jgi:hypothetical protein
MANFDAPGSQPLPTSVEVREVDENTLDESVLKTIWRDVVTIGKNVRTVLIPINWKFNTNQQALRNWDLWGPLVSVHLVFISCNSCFILFKDGSISPN